MSLSHNFHVSGITNDQYSIMQTTTSNHNSTDNYYDFNLNQYDPNRSLITSYTTLTTVTPASLVNIASSDFVEFDSQQAVFNISGRQI